jgi:hypothetical protein
MRSLTVCVLFSLCVPFCPSPGGLADPDCTVTQLFAALQGQAAALEENAHSTYHETRPLFSSEPEFIQALGRECGKLKKRLLSQALFDPRTRAEGGWGLSSMFAFPSREQHFWGGSASTSVLGKEVTASSVVVSVLPPAVCRFEGLSGAEAQSLLSSCEDSVFFVLRHSTLLSASGFSFGSGSEFAEAVALCHARMKFEEKIQRVAEDHATAGSAGSKGNESARGSSTPRHRGNSAKPNANIVAPAPPSFAPPPPRLPQGSKLIYVATQGGGPGGSTSRSMDYSNQFLADGEEEKEDEASAPVKEKDDEDSNTPEYSMSDRTRSLEDKNWKSVGGGGSGGNMSQDQVALLETFRSILMSSPLFKEASLPVMHTDLDVARVMGWTHGDPDTLRAYLVELARVKRRYDNIGTFHTDLRALAQRHDADELLPALCFPLCKIFSEAPQHTGVAVEPRHLRLLFRVSGNSLSSAKRCIQVLDRAGFKAHSMEQLVEAVKILREERDTLQPGAPSPAVRMPSSLAPSQAQAAFSPPRASGAQVPHALAHHLPGFNSMSHAPSASITEFLRQRQFSASSKRSVTQAPSVTGKKK